MDHDADNSTMDEDSVVILALLRRRAERTENYRGSLLLNPGVRVVLP